jgi:hypothetical protein
MSKISESPCTAFRGFEYLASGPAAAVAVAIKTEMDRGSDGPFLIFEDATGRELDFDLRGSHSDIVGRLSMASPQDMPGGGRGPGRPRLGVVAREVTWLPRHWDWLAAQPGGASVTLRRLVDEARRAAGDAHLTRTAQDAAYRFMSAMAGNLPGFEEASRALYAGDRVRFDQSVADWPRDIRAYAAKLAFGGEMMPA